MSTPTPVKLLYTVADAASLTSICRRRLYDYINAGELESILVGRSRLIEADALTAFVAKLCEASRNGHQLGDARRGRPAA